METTYNNAEDADARTTTSSEYRRRGNRKFHADGSSSQRETLIAKLTEQHILAEDEVRIGAASRSWMYTRQYWKVKQIDHGSNQASRIC